MNPDPFTSLRCTAAASHCAAGFRSIPASEVDNIGVFSTHKTGCVLIAWHKSTSNRNWNMQGWQAKPSVALSSKHAPRFAL